MLPTQDSIGERSYLSGIPLIRRAEARLGQWLGKGVWAVTDQGLFATSNFALNVLLARWLTPQDYGVFTVAFSVFLFFSTFHTALLTEPMLILGPDRYKDRLSEYLDVLFYTHIGSATLGSLLLLLASLGLGLSGYRGLSLALLGLLAGPFILFLWFMRRACYVRLEPHLAASGGALYMALLLPGIYALSQYQWLSAVSALGMMGFCSIAAGLWIAIRLRIGRSPLTNNEVFRETLGNHWSYGRWAVATSALTWIPGNVYYLLLPTSGGLEASAAFKALMNLIMPVLHANTALAVLLVPALVQARGHSRFGRLVSLALALFSLGSMLYGVLLGLFHHQLVIWLYGGQYQEYAYLLWPLGLSLLITGAVDVLGAALRALERPDRVFWAYLLSTLATLTLGAWFAATWGVVGAGAGFFLAAAVKALVMWAYYQQLRGAPSSEGGQHVVGTEQTL